MDTNKQQTQKKAEEKMRRYSKRDGEVQHARIRT